MKKKGQISLNRKFINGFVRGFYVTALSLALLIVVALGTYFAQENTQKIGYGENCLPAQEKNTAEIACNFPGFMA